MAAIHFGPVLTGTSPQLTNQGRAVYVVFLIIILMGNCLLHVQYLPFVHALSLVFKV